MTERAGTNRLRGFVWTAALGLVLWSCGSSGCRHAREAGRPTPPVAASLTVAASAPVVESAAPSLDGLLPRDDAPDADWRVALREHDWERAYQRLSALDETRRSEPPLRFVLAVAGLRSGRSAEAVALLDKLDETLPIVREEIQALRDRALALAGPSGDVGAALLATGRLEDALDAARALDRTGDPVAARKAADAAVTLASKARRGQESARLIRAELAEKAGDKATAVADRRWVMREKPEHALSSLARLDSLGAPPNLDERLLVLERASTSESLDSVKEMLETLRASHPGERAKLSFAWGKALAHARRFADAMPVFDEAAQKLTGDAAVDARYQAARAALRSGRERDAALRFERLANDRSSSRFGPRALAKLGEAYVALGRHADAARAFGRHLAVTKGRPDDAALYGHALALLGSGRAKQAHKALIELRKRAKHPRRNALLRQLEGVAAELEGKRDEAVAIWHEVIRVEPLSLAAWFAAARLVSLGHAADPLPREPSATVAPPPLTDLSPPPAVSFLASLGLDDLAEARLTREEDALAQTHPGRMSEALCELHSKLATGRRRLQLAERHVAREALMRTPAEHDRWAWRCTYPNAFSALVEREERERSLPRGFVHGVMRQESAFDVAAASPVGAGGLMQLMPTTATRAASEIGVTLSNGEALRPFMNVRLGAYYLSKLLARHQHNIPVTAAAYNAGPHAVQSWLAHAGTGDLDLWVARIPFRETRDYVAAVVGNTLRYQYLAGGAASVMAPSLALPSTAPLGDGDY